MDEYDPAEDARKSYDAAIEAKRARGDKHDWVVRPWKRREVIGNCTLYLGDCLEILPTIGKVDAVVTDPPYGIIHNFGVQKRKDGTRTLAFAWGREHTNPTVIKAVTEAGEKADAFFCFCGTSQVSLLEAALNGRFTVKPAVWIKSCPPPAMPGNWWPSGFEFALYGYTQGAHFGDGDTKRSNVFYTDTYRAGIRSEEKVNHPTQKWLPLVERIVRSVVPVGGVALDVFMGSGTTGVACVKLGRSFIGIEIDEGYFDIACERIRKAYAQPDFFVQQSKPEPPKQEALFGGSDA
ncbi:MAG TPA: DNA methyltransferase [Nitrospira sp.]|nr:DNA methyltransferase [Nitrospira sp.]